MTKSAEVNTKIIKSKAQDLGFFFCGISKAAFLADEAPRLEFYLKNQFQGKMSYLENHFDKRLDPRLLVDGAKSIVTLLFNYHNPEKIQQNSSAKISQYAYGEDYHFVVKEKLIEFFQYLNQEIGEINGRVFVDSAPVMDKAWAAKSGGGWVGKHSLLINPKQGSYFFVAELILDIELIEDGPIKDYCGTCTRCIDACPTDAIVAPYVVNGSKCISYLTIELKDEILPSEFKGKMDNWAFGCDICQDVCPWNKFATKHQEPRFEPSNEFKNLASNQWKELTEEVFQTVFKLSALKRTKYNGLKRNLDFLKSS